MTFESPFIYYVLFDTLTADSQRVRVRIWAVKPAVDTAYRTVLLRWRDTPRKSNNFQLHPPVNKDNNLATNNAGNLDLPLMFHAEESEQSQIVVKFLQTSNLPACVLHERE